MEIENFKIKEIWALPEKGFMRGTVRVEFKADIAGVEGSVYPCIEVSCFIPHDGGSTLEAVEATLLDDARTWLSGCLSALGDKDPATIRKQLPKPEPFDPASVKIDFSAPAS